MDKYDENVNLVTDHEFFSQELKKQLLQLDNCLFDDSMKILVNKWSQPAKSAEVLQVLDFCIFGSLTSNFYIRAMELLLNMCLKTEKITYEEIVKLATWREKNL